LTLILIILALLNLSFLGCKFLFRMLLFLLLFFFRYFIFNYSLFLFFFFFFVYLFFIFFFLYITCAALFHWIFYLILSLFFFVYFLELQINVNCILSNTFQQIVFVFFCILKLPHLSKPYRYHNYLLDLISLLNFQLFRESSLWANFIQFNCCYLSLMA